MLNKIKCAMKCFVYRCDIEWFNVIYIAVEYLDCSKEKIKWKIELWVIEFKCVPWTFCAAGFGGEVTPLGAHAGWTGWAGG